MPGYGPYARTVLSFCIVCALIFFFVKETREEDKGLPIPESPKAESPAQPKDPADLYLQTVRQEIEAAGEKKAGEEEKKAASAVLAFTNIAESSLETGWFRQADRIAFFVRIYLGEWQLPLLPKEKETKTQALSRLIPPQKLFGPESEVLLKDASLTMAAELESMLSQYAALLRYVQDVEVQDDGVRGKELASLLTKHYAKFVSARKVYLSELGRLSVPSEAVFLAELPIRRQIIAARHIFACLREISEELGQDTPKRDLLIDRIARLRALTTFAGLPPFKGRPLIERSYRAFLHKVELFLGDFERGLNEGFFPHVRTLLNDDIVNCRSAYNTFVQDVNL